METYTLYEQEKYNAIQMILPVAVGLTIPEDDPLYTFLEVMKGVDLTPYVRPQGRRGRQGYDGTRMLKIILFAYMNEIFSLRKIAAACRTDTRMMYLAGEECPSFKTIGAFISQRLRGSVEEVMVDINRQIFRLDKVDTAEIYLDGTALEANANKFSFVWKKTAQKTLARKLASIAALAAKEVIAMPAAGGSAGGQAVLAVLKDRMAAEGITAVHGKGQRKTAVQRTYDEMAKDVAKAEECEERIAICGPDRNSYSKVDHDATFMHMKYDYYNHTGVFKPGYNVQLAMTDEYIATMYCSNARSDSRTLPTVMDMFKDQYGRHPVTLTADAGYGSYNNYMYCLKKGIAAYIKYSTYRLDKHRPAKPYDASRFVWQGDRFICPQGQPLTFEDEVSSQDQGILRIISHYRCHQCGSCAHHDECTKSDQGRQIQHEPILHELRAHARQLLDSERGRQLRTHRSIYSEGTFGVIKQDYQYVRLHRRGMENVKTELALVVIGFNLRKYHNKIHRPTIIS